MSGTWRGWVRWLATLLGGVPLGLGLAFAGHFAHVLLGGNFRTVLPAEVYRCAQPSPADLQRLIARYGIRTVVNLRGACPGVDWYRDEAETTAWMDVALEDIHLSATRMPSVTAIRRLVEVLRWSERPLLIHCHQGADRTGLASVVVLLLRPGVSLAAARRQLGLSSGHLSVWRTGHVDRLLDQYESWLGAAAREHSPDTFCTWAQEHYCPAGGRARYTLLEPSGPVLRPRVRQRCKVTVRCHNDSPVAWHFKPGSSAGIHLLWRLVNNNDTLVALGRSALREAIVEPGGDIDVDFVLPPVLPGRYQLQVELGEEQHATFSQLGDEVLCVAVVVP